MSFDSVATPAYLVPPTLLPSLLPTSYLPTSYLPPSQTWLLAYEFPDTVLCITKEKLYAFCSQKKGTSGLVAWLWSNRLPTCLSHYLTASTHPSTYPTAYPTPLLTHTANILAQLNSASVVANQIPVETFVRTKDEAQSATAMKEFIAVMAGFVSALTGVRASWSAHLSSPLPTYLTAYTHTRDL